MEQVLKKEKPALSWFIITLSLFYGCAPKMHIAKSNWQSTPVYIYGQDKYVPANFFTDDNTNVNYSVSNDSNYLYIFIETNSEANVSGITQKGLQLWIDTTGKKNHQAGILCPFPQSPPVSTPATQQRPQRNWNTGNNQQGNPDTTVSAKHRHFLERTKQIHITGFKTVGDGLLQLPDTVGINVGVSWDNSNDLEYEVAISLKSLLKYPLLPTDSSKTIAISINFTSIQKRTYDNGGLRPGFGIGMGGMGMMMESGGHRGIAYEPEAETIWRPFHLTTVPKKP
jgi:hypothetical protein